MNDFVVKPARKKALVEAILRALPALVPTIGRLPEHSAPLLAPSCSATDNSVVVLEREVFRELVREIGEPAATEIHQVFTTETEARLKLFRDLAIDVARKRVEREAHSLKSSADTFGYRRLADLALRLERDATRLTEEQYRELLDRMATAYSSAAEQKLH